jgi:DNA-binding NarL/FixJ family response regulator
MTRVLLVDDYPLLGVGVRTTLNATADLRLIGFADYSAKVPELCHELTPDVLVISWRPTKVIPLDYIVAWHEEFPQMKILLMVTEEQREYARPALDRGVNGVMLKGDPLPVFELAIRTLLAGAKWFSPSLGPSRSLKPDLVSELTEREGEVLERIARGWDNATIAAEMHLAPQTVRNYSTRLYSKLAFSSRAEVIVWALDNGYGKAKD